MGWSKGVPLAENFQFFSSSYFDPKPLQMNAELHTMTNRSNSRPSCELLKNRKKKIMQKAPKNSHQTARLGSWIILYISRYYVIPVPKSGSRKSEIFLLRFDPLIIKLLKKSWNKTNGTNRFFVRKKKGVNFEKIQKKSFCSNFGHFELTSRFWPAKKWFEKWSKNDQKTWFSCPKRHFEVENFEIFEEIVFGHRLLPKWVWLHLATFFDSFRTVSSPFRSVLGRFV